MLAAGGATLYNIPNLLACRLLRSCPAFHSPSIHLHTHTTPTPPAADSSAIYVCALLCFMIQQSVSDRRCDTATAGWLGWSEGQGHGLPQQPPAHRPLMSPCTLHHHLMNLPRTHLENNPHHDPHPHHDHCHHRLVFYRERAAGSYGVVPFWLSETLGEVPWVLLNAALYSVVVYWR